MAGVQVTAVPRAKFTKPSEFGPSSGIPLAATSSSTRSGIARRRRRSTDVFAITNAARRRRDRGLELRRDAAHRSRSPRGRPRGQHRDVGDAAPALDRVVRRRHRKDPAAVPEVPERGEDGMAGPARPPACADHRDRRRVPAAGAGQAAPPRARRPRTRSAAARREAEPRPCLRRARDAAAEPLDDLDGTLDELRVRGEHAA